VLVLDILPLGADAGLEEMIIRLEGEFGGGSDVVLGMSVTKHEKGEEHT